ncbi:hypothetical protein DCAR_0205460 [Daucus carota subsp. sativus]|uniref:Uncharacterized protein n=1 Tax=Daucus carota subsp. sativus TaxID=79200 RepID=A0AAF0WBY1_DAUCS|nr:hypothetical protein DCAR_0205460 [Daucus carota subsp. sativus]
MLSLIPRRLALMAVQRHTAASRLTRPLRRLQHGSVGGAPTTTPFISLRISAQTPNFKASLGHFPTKGRVLRASGAGAGAGSGSGLGLMSQELTREKKRMFMARRRATEALHWVAFSNL